MTTTITAYEASKRVNATLKEAGVQKVLPPQMFYNYAKKGYIQTIEKKIVVSSLSEWLAKYLEKLGVQAKEEAWTDGTF